MTGQTLYDNVLTEVLDGEMISSQLAVTLFNTAKNKYELGHQLRFLLTEDASQSRSSGDDYTTAKTLPANFGSLALDDEGEPTLYIGSNFQPYRAAPFEQRRLYKDRGGFFLIDIGASQFYITDNASAGNTGTIYLPYFQMTDELADLTSSFSSRWPDRFIPVIGYLAAALYRGGTDFDDQNARMSSQNLIAAQELHNALLSWNARLAIQSKSQASMPRVNLSV